MINELQRDFASDFLLRQMDRVLFQSTRAVKSRDEESIHDLRVAIRRLIQGLAVFRPSFTSKKPRKMRKSLKQVLSLAGVVRDYDIALDCIAKIQSPHAERMRETLRAERKKAEAPLAESLKHMVLRKAPRQWRREFEIANLQRVPGCETVGEGACRELPRAAQLFFRRGDQAVATGRTAEQLHQFRLATKKFRYTFEIFAGLYRSVSRAVLEQLKALQQVLGKINDCASTRSLLTRFGAHADVQAALKSRERRKTAQFRQLWTAQFSPSGEVRQWPQILLRPESLHPSEKPAARALAPAKAAAAAG
jgi:CHAD domain-containing protein